MDYDALFTTYEKEGGELELPLFKKVAKKYRRLIDYYTFNRIDYNNINLVNDVKECILELIELFDSNRSLIDSYGQSQGLKSETVGELKEEYLTASMDEQRKLESSQQKKEYNIIKMYFGLTGLMYRGVMHEDKL